MNEIFRAAAEVQRFCVQKDWRFCIIGGIAVQRWADPRQTEDADLTLLTGFSGEQKFVDSCSAEDLIVHKAFAGRDLDWADVRSIVLRQGRKLNSDQIWAELRPLVALKKEPEILSKLQKVFDEALD